MTYRVAKSTRCKLQISSVPQLVQGYARRDCGHAPQTGVFWTLLLSRAAAVGLFAQCLIDKPDRTRVRQLYLTLLRAVAVALQSLISNSISVSELIVSAPLIIFERMKRGRALASSSTLPR